MNYLDKTKEELIKDLQELQKKYYSVKNAYEQGEADKKQNTIVLEKVIRVSEEFFHYSGNKPDYYKLSQIAMEISGAKYAVLNIFDENGLDFRTVAVAGLKENIKKALPFLGFDVLNKHWDQDPIRAEKTKNQSVTYFNSLHELCGNVVSQNAISLLEKAFGLGEVCLVKIEKDNKALGDFTLIFKKGETLINKEFINLFSHQVGLFIDRNKANNSLQVSEAKSSAILQALPDMMFIQNKEGVYFDFYLPANAAKFVPQKVFIGQKIQNVLPTHIVQEFKPVFENAVNTRQVQYLEYELDMPDEKHYFDARIVAIEDDKILSIVRDVTSQKKSDHELKLSNEKYRMLVENTNEALYVLQDGIFRYANKMCGDILEVPCKDLIGMSMMDFIHRDDKEKAMQQHLKIMKGELEIGRRDFQVITRSGSELWADVNSVRIEWCGRPATLNFATDNTERKRAEGKLILKNNELIIANAEKDKFFSIIAHDLRNPFNAFLGLTRLMVEDLPTLRLEEIQKMALAMRKSATSLSGLLENLLEWSCFQRGLISFEPEELVLRTRINEDLQSVFESANSKGIKISVDIEEDLIVFADSNMLGSILRNLSNNAVKFTPKGGRIIVSAKYSEEKNVEISIKDTGIGMSPSMLECLFQIDSQVNRKGTEGEPSTGLGLHLCKDFIEKHGGKIYVESEERKGTVFSFTLVCTG